MGNEFSGAELQLRREIMEAYTFLREKNMTIPSETLDFIKDAALEKLEVAIENRKRCEEYLELEDNN